jgi:hypothetical protein
MFRWPQLADFIGFNLIEVAIAMEDGSYWADRDDGDASECGNYGPAGDGGD